ncbi:MAG TPA: MoaD/ThiS family protein [Phycisphaerales bacterium]|nr:MoaD/ThiS family protein [Phycisphaerales bacterium]
MLLFGPAASTFGRGEVWVRVRDGATCREVLEAVTGVAPTLADHARGGRLAVNHEFAEAGRVVKGGDEVALIAMVSGG